jgi:hypothetical protein
MDAMDAPTVILKRVQKLWETGILLALRVHRYKSDAVPDELHAQLWGTCTLINHLLTMPERDEDLPLVPYFVPHVDRNAGLSLRDSMLEVAWLVPVRMRRLTTAGWQQFWVLADLIRGHQVPKATEQTRILARDFADTLADPAEWLAAATLYVTHKVPTGVRVLALN